MAPLRPLAPPPLAALRLAAPLAVVALAAGLLSAGALPPAAAAAEAGVPAAAGQGYLPLAAVDRFDAPLVDLAAAQDEDRRRDEAGLPPRFAIANPVAMSPETHGTWERRPDGGWLWRLLIESPGALSLNLGFTAYRLPPGARLALYPPAAASGGADGAGADAAGAVVPRALVFDERDNEEHGQLWTPVVLDDALVVELALPAAARRDYALTLSAVNVGYRFFGEAAAARRAAGATGSAGGAAGEGSPAAEAAAAKSGSCNNDVICPVGDPWRAEIPAVGAISLGGSIYCSGFLVNNTAEDQKPLFMTAFHCGVGAGNAASLVVYWNFQSPDCGDQSGGSLAQFQTGSVFRAAYAISDFTLVELDDPLDPAFQLSFAGWNRGDDVPTSAVAIHHPSGDEKSISFEDDPLEITSYLGYDPPGDATHLRVVDWDDGTTEGGSSGSPLFDQDHLVVGQLHGGYAQCGNDEPDWYGRLFVSWTGGGTAATRLSDWLDPLGTGAVTLPTLAPWLTGLQVLPSTAAAFAGPSGGPFLPVVVAYSLTNRGEAPLDYRASDDAPWLELGNAVGTIAPGGTAVVTAACNSYASQIGDGIYQGEIVFTNLTDHAGDTVRRATLTVGQPQLHYSWPLDVDPGWSTQGLWAWGQPLGRAGDHGLPDPTAGHTGSYVYGYNLNGGYTDNMPPYFLTLGPVDCAGLRDVTLKFWRWLGVEEIAYDRAAVFVRAGGADWTQIWQNSGAINDSAWQQMTFDVSDVADGQSDVYVAWLMGPTDESYNYCGWNIDDVEIWAFGSQATDLPAAPAPLTLAPNRPNPFNPLTEIRFALPAAARAVLTVHDVRGRLVRRLLAAALPAGEHVVRWDGRDDDGRAVASGGYLCRLTADGEHRERKMLLVR